MSMVHLKTNFKRDEIRGCRYDEIERDNRHLLHKMNTIAQEQGMGSPNHTRSMPALGAQASGAAFPGGPARRNEIARIEYENARMLKRLQNSHAEYRTKEWEACHDRSRQYVKLIMKYPMPKKASRRSRAATASLTPLGAGGDDVTLEAVDAAPECLIYVLKEDRLIGDVPYFVEMASDGQTLAVSAFDREAQDTLELLVNEENHHQLLFETNCDYGLIAQRLRVHEGRLVIASLEAFHEGGDVSVIPQADIQDVTGDSSSMAVAQ
jgi:hypothetical protein